MAALINDQQLCECHWSSGDTRQVLSLHSHLENPLGRAWPADRTELELYFPTGGCSLPTKTHSVLSLHGKKHTEQPAELSSLMGTESP